MSLKTGGKFSKRNGQPNSDETLTIITHNELMYAFRKGTRAGVGQHRYKRQVSESEIKRKYKRQNAEMDSSFDRWMELNE